MLLFRYGPGGAATETPYSETHYLNGYMKGYLLKKLHL